MSLREYPEAMPHGKLTELFPDIFFVTGSMKMQGRPLVFSRNMTVVRDGKELTLVNSVRLDEQGLVELERLGKVTRVIRLAGYHGVDDAYYKSRYDARILAIEGQSYVAGIDFAAEPYFVPDAWLTADSEPPFRGSRLYVMTSPKPPEAVVVLIRDGGILLCGDTLQNWQGADEYFNLPAKLLLRVAGFLRPCQVGPGWQRFARPSRSDLHGLLDLRFEHVLPAHGAAVIGHAKDRYRAAIERAASLAS